MAEVKDELLDHNYDGIQEYDNPMPGWWVYLFLFTIVWGLGYMYYYHLSGNWKGQEGEYIAEMNAAKLTGGNVLDNYEFTLLKDDASLNSGKEIYIKNCASCHGQAGEGGIGPNLTDEFWIHGGKFDDVIHIILEGVPAKSMIPWKTILHPDDVQKVGSYVYSLYGTNPPNPKAPEGEKFDREMQM